MLVCGSNCLEWEIFGERNETLATMVDVEEGEISDSASVEEISEEDFNKQEVKVVSESKPKEEARVWTMQDLYKYSINRGYSSGLYKLAWAQAVQNKPLNEIFVMDVDHSVASASSKDEKSSFKDSGKEVDKVVIDDSDDEMESKIVDVEKEEGELEEGEIDLDSEPVERVGDVVEGGFWNGNNLNIDELKEIELENLVKSIRETMAGVTAFEAEKSFEGVCSRLQKSLESMAEAFLENNVATKDVLVQLSFNAIQVVNSVFLSMNHIQKENNTDIYSRLLSYVKNNGLHLFSPVQMKEIEAGMTFLDSFNILLSTRDGDKEKVIQVIDAVNKGSDALAENKLPLDSVVAESLVNDNPNTILEAVKPGPSGFKGRGLLLPLLDLHKDHDADSLPSPTTEKPLSFPFKRAFAAGDGMVRPELAAAKVSELENYRRQLYDTDAFKAVSTYQQKFNQSSFHSFDRLPSPTPSEECDVGDGDMSGEVSSSSSFTNSRTVRPQTMEQPIISSSPRLDSSSVQGPVTTRNVAPVNSGSNLTGKASAKSRDPRLRFANPDAGALSRNQQPLPMVHNAPKVDTTGRILGSRKQKTNEEPIFDGPALKRQRNGLENSGVMKDVKAMSNGGWLEDTEKQFMTRSQMMENIVTDPRKLDNGITCPSVIGGIPVTTNANEPVPVTNTSTTAALPALLKDIAVNPTILINILKMGQQQRLAAETIHKSADPANSTVPSPNLNSILGRGPLVNVGQGSASGLLQNTTGSHQVPSQTAPVDESGKIRMKPRDPRRVLHGNALQKSGSVVSEQPKSNGPPTLNTAESNNNINAQKIESQAETKPMTLQSVAPPDITRLFTKNLKNIADIVSVSQAVTSLPVISQNFISQPQPNKPDIVNVEPAVSNAGEQQSETGSNPEVGAAATSQPQNSWKDVEHLFERYDDQQKAAIHRERARRMEEQKKMFAAKKLCLVLDLDHTLLNSAKFVEVDPVHDEILRKKEENDREKPQRHLFRFPHMGMWTKLRPGIWNFLEKASKLFELHLYTMGNKLYATEMAKVLDPKGVLFAGRVMSRGDDGEPFDGDDRVPKSKDLEGVLGMESAVVIIDDSVRVWPHHKLNLIAVERYTYFPCSRRQFGLLGPSLLEIDHDERPEDGTLACSLAVIERIHQIFFSHPSLNEVDVRNILASEQQKILAGCRIVFSRVFPVGEASPHLHPLWQTAEQFGAVCTNQIDEQVTHVVANSLGTDKVNWALSTGRFVVHPGWVEASALLYRRANEQDFATKP